MESAGGGSGAGKTAGCHDIGLPAAKRCFAFVYHTAISVDGPFETGTAVAAPPPELAASALARPNDDAPAPIAPSPSAVVLRNARLELEVFAGFMQRLRYLPALTVSIASVPSRAAGTIMDDTR